MNRSIKITPSGTMQTSRDTGNCIDFINILNLKSNFLINYIYVNRLKLAHMIIIILAICCFIPQALGYQFQLDLYPDGLSAFTSDSMFTYSLIASLSSTTPLLLEKFVSFLSPRYFNSNQQNSEKEVAYFTFPISLLLLIFGTDLFILAYVIPTYDYNVLPGLICARDILFTYSFLFNLQKLGGSVWTWPKLSILIFCSVSLNWIYAWSYMSEIVSTSSVILSLQYFLVSLMITSLLYFTSQWFHYVSKTEYASLQISTALSNMQTSVFAVFLCIYIISDFSTGLMVTFLPEPWSAYGDSYLALLTSMMTVCVMCVNVITTFISKIGQVEMSNKMLSERKMFLGYVSHEIRTPLNTTFLGLNVLKKQLLAEFKKKQHRCFKILEDTQKSCDIAVSILSDMLLFDKIDDGLLMLELESISPWKLFKSAVEPFFIQAKEAGMKILIEMKIANFICTMNADGNKISQVVRNLVSNALKFSSENSTIKANVDVIPLEYLKTLPQLKEISSITKNHGDIASTPTLPSHYVRFMVADTGAGISKENQAKLFQGIIQFTPGKLQAGKGTGLGLFISKGIINKHNGHIWIESNGEGLGSTFTVLLPIESGNLTNNESALLPLLSQKHIKFSEAQSSVDSIITSVPDQPDKCDFILDTLYTFDSDLFYDEESIENELNEVQENEDSINVVLSNSLNHNSNSDVLTPSFATIKIINILIVDDSMACRRMTEQAIITNCEDDGRFSVSCDLVPDGKKALDFINDSMVNRMTAYNNTNNNEKSICVRNRKCKTKYDLILMDYQMPHMDGPTAIREIRSLGYKGKIVGLTGNVMDSQQDDMLDAGADEVFAKPVSGTKLDILLINLYDSIANTQNDKFDSLST